MRTRMAIERVSSWVLIGIVLAFGSSCGSNDPSSEEAEANDDVEVSQETSSTTPEVEDVLGFDRGDEDIFGDVTAGGGSIWVASVDGLIEVDPSTMTATWHEGIAPGRPITYAFDSLWVANGAEFVVRRVDPETLEVQAEVPAGSPEGLVAGPNGVWVTEHQHGVIERIDPATNTVAETVTIGSPAQRGPMDPTFVGDDIWFVVPNEGTIVRVDPDGGVSRVPFSESSLAPVGSADAVWVPLGVAGVARIDRETQEVTTVPPPEGVTGAYAGVSIDAMPWFVGPDGMFAVDPATSEVFGTVPLHGGSPRNVVVTDEAAWVMGERPGTLERVSLDRLATSS